MKTDLSRNNPFSTYQSNFAANFTFGPEFDDWVCETMLPILHGEQRDGGQQSLVDVGAGPCYWAMLFLERSPSITITAIDPSPDLIDVQALQVANRNPNAASRLSRKCQSAQEFAKKSNDAGGPVLFDCIYFMQSAHYVGHDEFNQVFGQLASSLHPGGRIVIQARNMTPDWYPWAFPDEWLPAVENELHATDMFYRADRYAQAFDAMGDTFSKVEVTEAVTNVAVPADDYWQRLEDRWIPTFMSERIINSSMHRLGIDGMKSRFKAEGRESVCWTEKYAVVSAHV